MLGFVAFEQPEYDPDLQALTFAIPGAAAKGDVLLMLVAMASTSDLTVPDDWTDLGTNTATGRSMRKLARMIDGTEGASLVVELDATGDEVQGSLLLLRGAGSVALLVEDSGALAFAATMAPGSANVDSMQAIDLVVEAWSSSGALDMEPPAGFETIDTYTTALVTARTILVASKRANATGALTLGAASSDANATGSSFALVLRDGPPLQPAELVDLVPGNIGLLGKDNRPPREVA